MRDQPALYQKSTGCDHGITGAWNCYECGAEQRWVVHVEPVGTLTVHDGGWIMVNGKITGRWLGQFLDDGEYLIVKADDGSDT